MFTISFALKTSENIFVLKRYGKKSLNEKLNKLSLLVCENVLAGLDSLIMKYIYVTKCINVRQSDHGIFLKI